MSKFIFLQLVKCISYFPSSFKFKILNKLIKQLSDLDSNYFYTIDYKKKFFVDKDKKKKFNNSIILQGPIIRKNNFTFNTINLYLENCDSNIILSTWENQLSKIEVKFLKKKGIDIIISDIPKYKGPRNLNLQLKSTSEALKLSLKNGSKFSVKTRTDCRIYLEKFDKTLLNFFNLHKSNKDSFRIMSTSFTQEKRLFSLSDIVMFGKTEELLKYFPKCFSIKDFNKFGIFLKSIKNKEKNLLKETYTVIPENFLCYNYLISNVDSKIEYTLKSHYNCLKKYFIIIDNSFLDIYWYKYNFQFERRDKIFPLELGKNKKNSVTLSFSKWLRNYSNQ